MNVLLDPASVKILHLAVRRIEDLDSLGRLALGHLPRSDLNACVGAEEVIRELCVRDRRLLLLCWTPVEVNNLVSHLSVIEDDLLA